MKILVLCTGNSCRSQMAEGWLRYFSDNRIEIYSAGTHPEKINTIAIKVMAEEGIDISTHTSNHINEYLDRNLDMVISVCANAEKECPVFPKKSTIIHKGFEDPAKFRGAENEVLDFYRVVRDQIKEFSNELIKEINKKL